MFIFLQKKVAGWDSRKPDLRFSFLGKRVVFIPI